MGWQYYHTVWAVMGFGWISLYLVRMGIAPLLGMIMEEFQISYAEAGSLFSALFYSYSLMQLPSGYLGDRFGRKRILIAGTMMWFILSIVTSLVQSFTMLIVVRILTGIAQGTYFGNDRPTIVAFTPKDKMGKGQGISFIGLAAGFFLSVFLSGIIAEALKSWRLVFVVFSIPSLITVLLFLKYLRDPEKDPLKNKTLDPGPSYGKAFVDRDLWLMYLAGFVMLFGYWVIATWMPSIYREIGIKGIGVSSLLSGMLGVIGIPGLLIAGMMSDRFSRIGYPRKGFVAIMVFIWAILVLFLGYLVENRGSSILITLIFLTSGLFAFGVWSPYYAMLSEMAQKDIVGTTFGLANFIGFMSAWIAPYITGWIKDETGSFSGGLYLSGILLLLGALTIYSIRSRSFH
jgi:MFS family permease